jgi:hypothetical protein
MEKSLGVVLAEAPMKDNFGVVVPLFGPFLMKSDEGVEIRRVEIQNVATSPVI